MMSEHSSIGSYGHIRCSGKITIAKNVMFGLKCNLFAENHIFSCTIQKVLSESIIVDKRDKMIRNRVKL